MGGSSAPKPDKQAGQAALMSAETGRQMMEWMKDQAEITNAWAAEDRSRDLRVFRPLQDQFIADAKGWDSPQRKQAQAAQASGQVSLAARLAQGQTDRNLMSMGVNPASGAALAARGRGATDTALARAGAVNLSNRQVEAEADAKMANAINMGAGLAVNPGTSMGLSNSAGGTGFQGAMSGYGQQASILNQDYQNRRQAWADGQSGAQGLMGGVGTIAGAYGPQLMTLLSSKEVKTDKAPVGDGKALGAIRKMPVETWRYKPGAGDENAHVGTYAEDFAAATGAGDGKSIPIIDAIGVTMGAIKDLDRKVEKIARSKKAA